MKKLQIEHVLPYLPHGLTAEMLNYKIDYVGKKIDKIIGLHQWSADGEKWVLLTEGGSKPGIDKIKPVLKCMKLLTRKELEAAGFYHHIDYLTTEFPRLVKRNGIKKIIDNLPYGHFDYLVSKKYDIFNLIPEGLAVEMI